jgi:hypothetical protein
MASLIKQHDRYYLQFYDGSRSPKRRRIPLKTSTKRTALRLKGRLEDAYALGTYDPWRDGRKHKVFGWSPPAGPGVAQLGGSVETFLNDRQPQVRSSTLAAYRQILGWLVDAIGADKRAARLSPSDLRAFINKDTWSLATKRKHLRHVGVFVRWLIRQGALQRDITKDVRLPTRIEKAPKAMTRERGVSYDPVDPGAPSEARCGRAVLHVPLPHALCPPQSDDGVPAKRGDPHHVGRRRP